MTNDNDCTKPFFPSYAEPGNTSRATPTHTPCAAPTHTPCAAPTHTPCAEPDDTDNDAVQAWPPYAEMMLDDEPF